MSDKDFDALVEKAKAEILSYYATQKNFMDYDDLKAKLGIEDELFCKILKALAEPSDESK